MTVDVLTGVRQQVAVLTADRGGLLSQLAVVAAGVSAQAAAARAAAAVGDDAATTAALAAAADLRTQRRGLLAGLDGVSDQVRAAIEELATAQLDPCDAEADVPLLLLPVRLETRYSPDGTALRVRIHPDDVHVDRLDTGVSDVETAAGTAYWTAVWTGTATGDQAWAALVTAVHPDRAAWVAYALTPGNLADRPDPPAAAGGAVPAPVFPAVAAPTDRAPVARALPDRFVVVVEQGTLTATATGAAVPPEVVVGLPRDDDPSVLVTADGATLGPGMAWMADFDVAAGLGLAVTVALPTAGAAVDRVTAFGVRSSLDPTGAAAEVRALIVAHRFADGLDLIPQGTPTNNTETDRTAWTARTSPPAPPVTVAAWEPAPGTGAAALSAALGIEGNALAGTPNAGLAEDALAGAANAALWPASWGTFLGRVATTTAGGAVDDVSVEGVRDLFTTWVRGRGPLPAVRIGNQPYGVLPVTVPGPAWPDDPGLAGLLDRIRALSRGGIPAVPTLPAGPLDSPLDTALLEILGSSPLGMSLRVRSIASATTVSVVPPLLGITVDDTAVQALLDGILWQSLGFADGVVGTPGSLGKTTRALGLPLVADSDPTFIAALLAGAPRTVASVLQALVELSLGEATAAVAAAAPPELVGKLLDPGVTAAGDLGVPLREYVDSALQGDIKVAALHDLAGRLAERVGPAGPIRLSLDQPVAATRRSLADVAMQPGLTTEVAGQLVLRSLQAWMRAQARLAEVRAALGALAAATTADRAPAVAETLDLCSHRLDAWLTALVARRLAALRTQTPGGLVLGAYGWVEDLVPASGTVRDGGYLLAPTTVHATTAAVLRSAYLSHNPPGAAAATGPFAIDLSSARVRRALAVLDGIGSGQPLGALLGYSFERALRESPADVERFVLSLRTLAPLNVGRIVDRAETLPPQAREAVSANNVVDGLALLALRDAGTDIRTALGVAPPNNPYLDPARHWTGPAPADWAAITAALDSIAADHDAVADLLMAEGVHQLVGGNMVRAAAVLDAAASGDAPPPDPDVARIPARGTTITHRLGIAVRDVAAGTGGWSTTTPRALAEPRLAGWAESVLGPATRVVVQVAGDGTRTLLDAAGLAALDVIYDAGLPGVLERRLRTAIPTLSPAPLATGTDPTWPAGSLGLRDLAALAASVGRLLAGADPLLPASFGRPGDAATRAVPPAALADLTARVTAAIGALDTATTAVAALLAGPPPAPAAVGAAVDALAAFGIAVAGDPTTLPVASQALHEGVRRHAVATAALGAAPTTLSCLAAGHAAFGDGFWTLPVVSPAVGPAGADLFAAALANRAAGAPDPSQPSIRRFLRDAATVRVPTARHTETLLVSDALAGPDGAAGGADRQFLLAQLAPSGTRGADRWFGLPFDPAHPSPTVPVACVLLESTTPLTGPAALTGTDSIAGVVVDEWQELVPTVIERPDGAGGTVREPLVTAGVAANVETPAARAPQVLLLAVSPDGSRWTSDAVRSVLAGTLDLAKLRGVTLERSAWTGRILPALQEASWSLQGEATPDLRHLVTELASTSDMLRFVRDDGTG